jgi:hypothetical protein
MTMIFILLALALAAPESAAAHDFVRVDARGAVQSIDAASRAIGGLSDVDRGRVSASLGELTRLDPYTGAAMQIPFVLQAQVARIPADRFDPVVAGDWAFLQDGLATHVDLLRSLGVQGVGANDAAVGSRIAGIDAAARRLDAPTRARIAALSDDVEALTGVPRPCPRGPHADFPGHPWTLGMQLGGWHDALRRVQPFATDAATRDEVGRLIALVSAFARASQP